MDRKTLILILGSALSVSLSAQNLATPLITQAIDETKLVTLHSNVHPLAQSRYDLGPASASVPAKRMLLLLQRPADREAALAQYIKEVHTVGSAAYHRWITPEEFGARFGPSDSDIEALTGWLSGKGFQVSGVSKARLLIEFSGTVGQVNPAFHTQIHEYAVKGELHYANATDPQIPEALADAIRGISPLNDFHAKPNVRVAGRAHLDPVTKKLSPDFTPTGSNGSFFGVGPEDFATQYDLAPLYAAGVNGSGRTIGIINDSNIDVSLDNAYRSLFNLSTNPAQVVIDGGDPGLNGDDMEAFLDVEVAGSVAPAATVDLYIASPDTLDQPLLLAAQRAIEDNQADVLSISFGSCEADLEAYNQILAALWEQAAAQGQTVFVAAGDNGSAGCDDPASPRVQAVDGLAVNGFASTPWNVAVGGTDFYYSDYASGAPSAATLWNATNDANYGSLKAPLPEQVWNDSYGFNAIAGPGFIVAGSGGVSTLYPKPRWQTATGVPSDGHRDLPDVSLFAADGFNLSGYVICINPGDCIADSNNQIPVSVVGGTSASAPAMAGIMALVNQKHGRQGQANFTLYPLARQKPSAFHDITFTGNNVPCLKNSPHCVFGTNQSPSLQYTMSGYSATAGYDLASGLGSIDANVLVTNWGMITFLPTITTLQLSSTSFTHGTPVTITSNVFSSSSGAENPQGDISILSNSPLPSSQGEDFLTLQSNGSASGMIASLPGGTYQLWASYGGDGVYSGSQSSPVTLTVMPQASTIAISATSMVPTGLQSSNPGINCVPFVGQNVAVANGSTVYAGDVLWLNIEPRGSSHGLSKATGSVTFILDGQPATVPLNVNGIATWTTPATAGSGLHTVTASYSGDASYNPSQSPAFTYTVKQGQSVLNMGSGGVCGSGITCTAYAGDNFPVPISLQVTGCQVPAGTVTVKLGSQAQVVTLSQEGSYADEVLTGVASFSDLTAGTYQLSATYDGDSNYQSSSAGPFTIIVASPSGTRVSTTTTISESNSVVYVEGGSTVFTATVTGASGATGAPTGAVTVYANGEGETIVDLAPAGPNSATGTSSAMYSSGFNYGLNQITSTYTGDSKYRESVSAPVALTLVSLEATPDFNITPQVPEFVVHPGGSSNTSINLTSTYGFSGIVSLSCTSSATIIGCSVSPSSVNVSGSQSVTLTVTAAATTGWLRPSPVMRSGEKFWMMTGGSAVMGGFFLGGFSRKRRKRNRQALVILAVFALIVLWTACGGGGGQSSPVPTTPPTTPTQTPPPAPNTYGIIVSGMANETIHNAKVFVAVQ